MGVSEKQTAGRRDSSEWCHPPHPPEEDALVKQTLILATLATLGLAVPACLAEKPADEKKADVQSVARSNNRFAVELYGRLRQKDGNISLH
jgi:hypothetical protein